MELPEIISALALFIAILALGGTFWQGYLTRRHNILSVKPHLIMSHNFKVSGESIKFNISNNGVGPAFITSFSVEIDGKEYDLNNVDEPSFLFKELGLNKDDYSWKMTIHEVGGSIQANSKDHILSFPNCEELGDSYQNLRSALPRLKFVVKYACMYGNEYSCE